MIRAHSRLRTLIGLFLLYAAGPGFAAGAPTTDQSQPEYSRPQQGEDPQIAVRAARAQVAEARQHAADDPAALSDALTTLGDALLASRDYASAQIAYGEALQIAEQQDSVSDARTFGPLRGLGYVLAAMGRHEEAVPYLERALTVARSKYGVVDPEQIELLQGLSNSLTALGRGEEAQKHLFYTLRLAEKTYGEGDPRVAPAICALGDWYAEVFHPLGARYAYQTALNIVTRSVGPDDLAAVEPLRGFARIDMQVVSYPEFALRVRAQDPHFTFSVDAKGHRLSGPRKLTDDGERALRHALEILDAHGKDAPRPALIATLIQLGDWYQIKQSPREALPYYQRAWTLMTLNRSQPAPDEFGFPVRVFYPTPNVAAPRTASAVAPDAQFVEVEFNVDADGGVSGARIVHHDTTQRYADQVLSAVRDARYRPKFVDGKPVATPAMSYREVLSVSAAAGREDAGD